MTPSGIQESIRRDLTVEFRLILAYLSATDADTRKRDIERLLQQKPAWDEFLSLCMRHKVAQQIYYRMDSEEKAALPESVSAELKDHYQKNRRRAMEFISETIRLLGIFKKNRISVLSIKGPELAQWVYGDVGVRHVGDLDLLISPEDFDKADRLIQEEAYEAVTAGLIHKNQLKRLMPDAEYYSYRRRIYIELHWRLTPRKLLPLSPTELFNHSITNKIGGFPVQTLGPEDRILHLLVHGSDHAWFRLKWLNDMAYILTHHGTLDWARIADRVESLGLDRVLHQTLYLAHGLFDVSIPDSLSLPDIPNRRMNAMITTAMNAMHDPEPFMMEWHTMPVRQVLEGLWYRAGLHRSLRYKAGILQNMLVRPKDWDALPLPEVLFPLYYVLGPVLFVKRHLFESK